MKYRELYDEYRELLVCETKLRQEIYRIPKGYLVTKKLQARSIYICNTPLKEKRKANISTKMIGLGSKRLSHGGSLRERKWKPFARNRADWKAQQKF